MQLIALLLVSTAAAQPPPPDEPPPLKPGEMSYQIKINDDTWWYVSANENEFLVDQKRGNFKSDDVVEHFIGRQWRSFENYIPEDTPGAREKRWREAVAKWRDENGYVKTEFADGSMGWVKEDDLKWAKRAREAAARVIRNREATEADIVDAPKVTVNTGTEQEPPGIVELWGPQAAVALLGLVLMGVAARFLFFPNDSGWQKIE